MKTPYIKNRGYTLIELVIVVAIIAILGMVLALNVNTGAQAKAKGCAEEINALLSRCRVESMSRAGNVRLNITTESEGLIRGVITVEDGGSITELENRVLAKESLTVSPMPLTVGFDRSTGAMRFYAEGVETAAPPDITVSGGGLDLTIALVPSTGLHYLEDNSDE